MGYAKSTIQCITTWHYGMKPLFKKVNRTEKILTWHSGKVQKPSRDKPASPPLSSLQIARVLYSTAVQDMRSALNSIHNKEAHFLVHFRNGSESASIGQNPGRRKHSVATIGPSISESAPSPRRALTEVPKLSHLTTIGSITWAPNNLASTHIL